MNVLVVDTGTRGEALRRRLQYEGHEVYVGPGNGGSAVHGRWVPSVSNPTDISAILTAAENFGTKLIVGGGEQALVAGLVNHARARPSSIPVFGPSAAAARIEGSKAALAYLCKRAGIPRPRSRVVKNMTEVEAAIADELFVVKADGLCRGQGVTVARDPEAARQAAYAALVEGRFGEAGRTVVMEERLIGAETSLFYLADGLHSMSCSSAQDYKRLSADPDALNTGGMGAISPAPGLSAEMLEICEQQFVTPLLTVLRELGTPYQGVLYIGMMWTFAGPKLLEVNVRFGDPEASVLLPRLVSPLFPYLEATTRLGGLANMDQIRFSDDVTVGVVLADHGYPGTSIQSGVAIHGIREAEQYADVYLAGVRYDGAVRPVHPFTVTGGRVLVVVGRGKTVTEARERAYQAAACINLANGERLYCHPGIAAGL